MPTLARGAFQPGAVSMGLFWSDPQRAQRKALQLELSRLRQHPGEVRVLMRVARLESRLGQVPQAVAHYGQAARACGAAGFWFRAVAVNKLAIALAPSEPELLEQEAEFYAQLELLVQALASLRKAIALTARLRGTRPGRLVVVDENSASGWVLLAEHHLAEGREQAALRELARVARSAAARAAG